MATWDRFDIAEAHCLLEWDYNVGGILQERPSNQRRRESTGVQLARMKFCPPMGLSFDTLSDNGREIYLERVLKWKLPIDTEQQLRMEDMFVPEHLHKMRPDIWLGSDWPSISTPASPQKRHSKP